MSGNDAPLRYALGGTAAALVLFILVLRQVLPFPEKSAVPTATSSRIELPRPRLDKKSYAALLSSPRRNVRAVVVQELERDLRPESALVLADAIDREADSDLACRMVVACRKKSSAFSNDAASRRLVEVFENSRNEEVRNTILAVFRLYPVRTDSPALFERLSHAARTPREKERAKTLALRDAR